MNPNNTSPSSSTKSTPTATQEDNEASKALLPPDTFINPPPSTSRPRRYDFTPRGKNVPSFKLLIKSSASSIGSINSDGALKNYIPPPATASSTSGTRKRSASTLLAHQYYSAQMQNLKTKFEIEKGGGESNTKPINDSNANLQRYGSLGFGIQNSQDSSKRDIGWMKTLNTPNNNNNSSFIAYPVKVSTKGSHHSTIASSSKPPKESKSTTTATSKALKESKSTTTNETGQPIKGSKSKSKAAPIDSKSKTKKTSLDSKSTGKASSKAAKSNAANGTEKKEKETRSQSPKMHKLPPKTDKSVTTEQSESKTKKSNSGSEKSKSGSPSRKGKRNSPSEKNLAVAFENQDEKTMHAGHLTEKQKKIVNRRKTGMPSKHKVSKEKDEENEDFEHNIPPPPSEFADDITGTSKAGRRGSGASHDSHKSTGPTIEDDRTGGKAKKPFEESHRFSITSDRSSRDSGGSHKSKLNENADDANRRNSTGSQTVAFSPPPSPPPEFKDEVVKSREASEDKASVFSSNGLPRTPPQEAQPSPPPPTPSVQQTENPGGGEEHTVTLPVCTCNNAKLVQAQLVNCFETQGRSQCCGGGGKCCCQPPSPCFTPCCCQRCRVYHYCFNILNRHTLKPEDMFHGISAYEQNVMNSLHRQNKLNVGKSNCATSHIITNSSENQGADINADMEARTGAKNWYNPPEGYQDASMDNGGQFSGGQSKSYGGHCRESSGMINPWQTEYTSQFRDFSDQIRRSSSKYASYDEGFGGRFGGGSCSVSGAGKQGGRQKKLGSCFDDGRDRSSGFGGSYGENGI